MIKTLATSNAHSAGAIAWTVSRDLSTVTVNGVDSFSKAQLRVIEASSTNGPVNTCGPRGSGLGCARRDRGSDGTLPGKRSCWQQPDGAAPALHWKAFSPYRWPLPEPVRRLPQATGPDRGRAPPQAVDRKST